MNSCGIFAKNIWQFTKGKAPRNTSWAIRRELSKEEGGITASWNGWHHFFKAFHEMRHSSSGTVDQGVGVTSYGSWQVAKECTKDTHVYVFTMFQVGKFTSY